MLVDQVALVVSLGCNKGLVITSIQTSSSAYRSTEQLDRTIAVAESLTSIVRLAEASLMTVHSLSVEQESHDPVVPVVTAPDTKVAFTSKFAGLSVVH